MSQTTTIRIESDGRVGIGEIKRKIDIKDIDTSKDLIFAKTRDGKIYKVCNIDQTNQEVTILKTETIRKFKNGYDSKTLSEKIKAIKEIFKVLFNFEIDEIIYSDDPDDTFATRILRECSYIEYKDTKVIIPLNQVDYFYTKAISCPETPLHVKEV